MEPFAKIPLWLELAGLPAAMNKAARSPAAWAVFCKLVALDCQRAPAAGIPIVIPIRNLADSCGIAPAAARRILGTLRRKKWIAAFLPDNDEEEALFQIKAPLPAPLTPEQVKQAHPSLFTDPTIPLRYETSGQAEEGEPAAEDPALHEIIDLYFNTISMKMNSFILDELRLVRQRFELPLIRRIFQRAKNHGIDSMGWVLRELHRESAKKLKEAAEKAQGEASSPAE